MRRALLWCASLLVFGAPLLLFGQPQPGGILFDASDLPAFRRNFSTNPLFGEVKSALMKVDRSAERAFLRDKVRYNDQLYDIGRVGNLAIDMAFLYLYSGDEDAAALAKECVESLMHFPKWDYFLDGGTDVIGLQRAPNSALAVSIVIECLGEKISENERRGWLRVMGERGTEPSYRSIYGMRYPDRVKGWGFDTTSTYLQHRPGDRGLSFARWPIILNTINLKAIPASALTLSALTYRKYMGENADTRRWIEQALFSLRTFRDIYTRDGSYGEGVSYAAYTTLHLVQAAEALRRAGIADLTTLLNWQGYMTYLIEMTQPTAAEPAAIVNFSDSQDGASSSVPFWIARLTRDGQAQWFGEHLAVRRDIWSLLWYDSTVRKEAPPDGVHLWKSDLDWVVCRTGYGEQDLVVAMRSGVPQNHEHADRNSLTVKCFGEKLVADPMRPPYIFTDPAWRMRLTEGHSALLIDGKGHQYVDGREGTNASQAHAEIVRWGVRDAYAFWTSNATQPYQLVVPDVRSVTRTVVMLHRIPAVVVIDKVIKEREPSRIQARFFAYNNDSCGSITADASGFTVTRPTSLLTGKSIGNSQEAYQRVLLPVPEETARRFPAVDALTGTPQKEIFLMTVLLPHKGTKPTGAVQLQKDGPVYSADIRYGDRSIHVRVHDSGEMPEFEVR
jgi:hypothetical protein